jgi:AAA domain
MSTTSNYLVKGILPRTGLAVVWGPPKCGKSFWTFDLVVHIALGRQYRGRPVRQGTVIYCALEGGGGFGNRIEAWRRQHLANGGEPNVPFYLIPQPFDLIASHQHLIDAIRDELGKAAPAVIVVDTLNRALVGDENKSDDMAKFIKALGAVQAAFDCLVLVVHHCGIAGSRPRGHTSLAGADDAQIRIERAKDGTIRATIEHAKDFEAGDVLACKLEKVELGRDSDGDVITSCVIIPSEASAAEPKLPKVQQLAYDALKRTIKDEGVEVKAKSEMAESGVPVGQRACLTESWRHQFYVLHEARKPEAKRQALFRATLDLEEAKLIKLAKNYVWLLGQPA